MIVDLAIVVTLGVSALFALWLAVTAVLAYFRLSEKYEALRDKQQKNDSRVEALLRSLLRAPVDESDSDTDDDSDGSVSDDDDGESVSESESQLEESWLAFNRPAEVSRENEFDMPSVYSTWLVFGSALKPFLAGFEKTFPDHSHFSKKPEDEIGDVELDDLIVWDLRHLSESQDEAAMFVVKTADLKKYRHAFWLDDSQTTLVEGIEHLVGVIAPIAKLETLSGIRDQDLLTIPSYLTDETLRKRAIAAWVEHGATHYARMPDEGLVILGETLPASEE
jgi:hypothetical protein